MIVAANAVFQADEHNSVSGIKRKCCKITQMVFQEVIKS